MFKQQNKIYRYAKNIGYFFPNSDPKEKDTGSQWGIKIWLFEGFDNNDLEWIPVANYRVENDELKLGKWELIDAVYVPDYVLKLANTCTYCVNCNHAEFLKIPEICSRCDKPFTKTELINPDKFNHARINSAIDTLGSEKYLNLGDMGELKLNNLQIIQYQNNEVKEKNRKVNNGWHSILAKDVYFIIGSYLQYSNLLNDEARINFLTEFHKYLIPIENTLGRVNFGCGLELLTNRS